MSELSYRIARSPARRAPQGLSVSLREIPDRGMIDLRGLASDRKFMAAAKEALGIDLPRQPRTSVAWGDIKRALAVDRPVADPLPARARSRELLASAARRAGRHPFARRRCLRHARGHPPGRRRLPRDPDEGHLAGPAVRRICAGHGAAACASPRSPRCCTWWRTMSSTSTSSAPTRIMPGTSCALQHASPPG